jgi:hypothetical protein
MKRKLMMVVPALLILASVTITQPVYAQDDPPPPPGEHGLNGDQPKDAPIGEGGMILAGLAVAFGVFRLRKSAQTEK